MPFFHLQSLSRSAKVSPFSLQQESSRNTASLTFIVEVLESLAVISNHNHRKKPLQELAIDSSTLVLRQEKFSVILDVLSCFS